MCGMRLSTNLGTYLGVPIVHGRFNHFHCSHIVEKSISAFRVGKRTSFPLLVEKTLIRAVISVIPNYAMQKMKFLIRVCDKIDKLNREFLWGDSENKKKVHLVKWRNACKPKKHGGHVPRYKVENNIAINAKLGWRIMNENNPFWIKALKAKYKVGGNPKNWKAKINTFHIWKSIFNCKAILGRSIKWMVVTKNT